MISIIIPSYNYAHLLPDTLFCLKQQTVADWECFVIDNGSTDNTKEIVRSFSEKDNRIKYFYQSNSGPAAARNQGIKLSKGEYIQFLDADDLLENKKFEVQMGILKNDSECDIVYSDMNYFSSGNPKQLFNRINLDKENDKPWMKKISGVGDKIIKSLLHENIMVINSPLVRKSIFEKAGYFDEELKYNEDWDLWVRCAFSNVNFLYDDAPQTKALVRVHNESHSNDRFKMYVYGLKACLKINKSVNQWKYKRIIVPKIFYHQSVLDKKILECYNSDKRKAEEMIDLVYAETQLSHFSRLKNMFYKFPYSIIWIYSKMIFLTNILRRKTIYAS